MAPSREAAKSTGAFFSPAFWWFQALTAATEYLIDAGRRRESPARAIV
jgi:hypothetical protein